MGILSTSRYDWEECCLCLEFETPPLRGITSEGMMLAADDGDGNVRLVTIDGDIKSGSQVR